VDVVTKQPLPVRCVRLPLGCHARLVGSAKRLGISISTRMQYDASSPPRVLSSPDTTRIQVYVNCPRVRSRVTRRAHPLPLPPADVSRVATRELVSRNPKAHATPAWHLSMLNVLWERFGGSRTTQPACAA
jgi:hypothetical protein